LDPGSGFDLWLDADGETPAESRPVFVARYLTWRQEMELRAIRDRLVAADEPMVDVFEGLRLGLIGWRGMGRPFDADAIEDLLTGDEALELFCKLVAGQRPSGDAAKKSASPPESDAAESAAAAGAATA